MSNSELTTGWCINPKNTGRNTLKREPAKTELVRKILLETSGVVVALMLYPYLHEQWKYSGHEESMDIQKQIAPATEAILTEIHGSKTKTVNRWGQVVALQNTHEIQQLIEAIMEDKNIIPPNLEGMQHLVTLRLRLKQFGEAIKIRLKQISFI